MIFKCQLHYIQHIKELNFSVDLSNNQLMCIVGKNGVGKTTLIRAIKNIKSTDTFANTASPNIFNSDSRIYYAFDQKSYDFTYNESLKVIDTNAIIDPDIQKVLMLNSLFLMVKDLVIFSA